MEANFLNKDKDKGDQPYNLATTLIVTLQMPACARNQHNIFLSYQSHHFSFFLSIKLVSLDSKPEPKPRQKTNQMGLDLLQEPKNRKKRQKEWCNEEMEMILTDKIVNTRNGC